MYDWMGKAPRHRFGYARLPVSSVLRAESRHRKSLDVDLMSVISSPGS